MMKVKLAGLLFVLVILFATSQPALGYDISLGDNIDVLVKGDITYTLKVRAEDADDRLIANSAGNSNFEDAGDLTNNKIIGKVEIEASGYDYYTFFVRAEAFYDFVFMDYEDFFDNPDTLVSEDVAEARRYNEYYIEALEYYLEGNYEKLTFRVGRQVVQWGLSLAPAYAPGVNVVSPFYGAKIAVAGYTYRDYQYPTLMAMVRYRPTDLVEIEGVYSPDFSPDDYMAPAGSFYSFTNTLGHGDDGVLKDKAPKSFSDMQQYGAAVRTIWPGLNNFELGFYYYHSLDRSPNVGNETDWMSLLAGLGGDMDALLAGLGLYKEYPEIDMYGIGFSQAIDWWDMNVQINGDIAYRPNDTIAVKDDFLYINDDTPEAAQFASIVAASLGLPVELLLDQPIEDLGVLPNGYDDEGGTVNWVLGGMRIFSDVFPFLPYTFASTPLFEFYGQHIMDYDDDLYKDLENTAFYFLSVPFSTADMIDNTTITFNVDASGAIHYEQRSLHKFAFSVKAKYGDNLQALLGYDLVIGIPAEELRNPTGGSQKVDRDAVTFSLTYFFI